METMSLSAKITSVANTIDIFVVVILGFA